MGGDQSYSMQSRNGSMLNLRLAQSRRHVESNRESTVFAQVEISPDLGTEIAQKNHHICLVIDCSGSMTEDGKMDRAKETAINVVRRLPDNDIVSIVTFDDDAHTLLDPKPASERQYIENQINSIVTGYATAMYAGISKAFDLVLQNRSLSSSNTINRLVVITDGIPTSGPCEEEDFIKQAKEIRQSGVTTSTTGIGDEYGDQLLKSISEFGGGNWDHVANASDLSKAVNDQAIQMQNTIITNPQLRITLMDGAELFDALVSKPVIRAIADCKTIGNVTTIGLKDVVKDEPHALHLKIKIPSGQGENMPFLTAEILEGTNVVAGPHTLEISYTLDRNLYSIENKDIFLSHIATESTICNGKFIATGDLDAKKRSDTINNILPNSATLKGLAHDTVANAKAIQGMIEPDLTEAEKKKLLHRATMMGDTMTNALDDAINEIKKPKDEEEESK